MLSVSELKASSSPRAPLGHVNWILPASESMGISGEIAIGITNDGSVDWDGTGYVLFDAPVYPLSSSQRLKWESGSQKIMTMIVDATGGGQEFFEQGDGDGEEPELTSTAKVSLMGAMANNAVMIREIHEGMVEAVLRVPTSSSMWIQSVSGLGSSDGDLFAEVFQAISEMLKPKATAPNELDSKKKRSR